MSRIFLPLIILVIAIAGSFVIINSKSEPEQSELAQSSILVDVMNIQTEDTYLMIPSQGTIEPRTSTSMVSEVSGQVVEVSPKFVVGGFFRQGDLLLRLDDQNYRAAVSRNVAAVASAKSQLEQERGQADVAQREWDRLSSERQSQVRAKDLYLRKPQLEEALSRLAAAEADLAQSENDLRKTTILAPYDGLVSSKGTDIGQFVSTGSGIAETFSVDYAEVRLPISETKIQFIDLPETVTNDNSQQQYPKVELISELGDTKISWTGDLVRTEGVLDIRTRVLFSVVRIKDPYGLYSNQHQEPLRIGTYVNANIQGKLLKDVVVLPRHTLRANNIVWVADPENRLRAREVKVVTVNGDNAFISAGLEPSDRVVITRLENPLNSMLIQANPLPTNTIE